MDNMEKYFKMPGGIKRFKEDNHIVGDLSRLKIRQIIKTKNLAKHNLKVYEELFSNWDKRLQYTRYMKAVIDECTDIQRKRRKLAVEHYLNTPPEQRVKKNWIVYTKLFAEPCDIISKTND